MEVIASSSRSGSGSLPLLHSHRVGPPVITKHQLGRRRFFFNGISTICSHDESHNREFSHLGNNVEQIPSSAERMTLARDDDDTIEVIRNGFLSKTRRGLFASVFAYTCYHPSRYLSAHALSDPSVTVEQVTPLVYPSGKLFPSEERIVQLFEKNTYSVVNIFDVTLRPQLNVTGVVEIPEGNGSGVIWDGEGHIVTNYHVIGNSLSRNPSSGQVVARVNILASEGVQKNFEGKLVGADRAKDLAVLKVEAPEELLRPIKVGQSSSLKVGQQCLAIGNPFGFDHTLTVGVISGLNRDIFSQTGVTIGGGVQTDAAINPGNSGGPLLNSKGDLIGINTAIFTQTGTSAGVGFAIPSSTVVKIVPQLIQFGKVVRAGLNVEIAPDLVANQLNVRNGALVLQVPGNSVAGLLPTTRGFAGNIILGDIITSVDNKTVRSKAELYKALEDYNVGDKVVLKILRGNENLELPVILEEKE
ncbi:protease Do-like 8, chloroplastic isoform X2 [Impatiens glandulifera]|uniref:protease Do-like 8, chloroplastic isoform X2 n=1 Tax=Impatiens glandulifera TaxID=253017 RepID=UPI001FB0745A|nr:protease Do-like 8, chloroplastic isoform X2 [Impatiens glandulifera]